MANSNISPSQAQAFVSLFNSSPTQQKYSITIQDSGGNRATTTFTFSLQKPNIFSETLSALNPFNWASTTGEVWTGITTGNADVALLTSSPLLISNTQNIVLDNHNPFGTESLDIATPANLFDFLYHQINNAVTVTAKIFYCSPSAALVGINVSADAGVIASAGYSIVSASGLSMTMLPSILGNGSDAFLQVGTLDSQILSIAQSTQSANNPSQVYGVANGNNSNNSNNTPTVVVTPTVSSNSSNSSGSSSTSPVTYATPSTSTSYGMASTGANTGGGATTQSAQQYTTPTPSSGSKMTEYLLIGGVALVGIAVVLFLTHKKH
ncbi:MAG: hypothetical protein M1542_08490 [Thermotogae bacterium]|jgi:hypothetical protein|nr:hypothetical protein [Thermotogota bacterium]